MKLTIVHDCGHVLEDIIPFIDQRFEVEFIQRTRKKWSKTFGLFWKILRSNGDVYHVNYALQDAYLTSKLKHLDVLYCHGSDVRVAAQDWKWSRMVRHNLKAAKIVLYSTRDMEGKIRKYRDDAIFMPRPVRTERFSQNHNGNCSPKAVYFELGYELLPNDLQEQLESNGILLDKLSKTVPYQDMPKVLSKYDIFIDRFTIPSLSKTCLESMSCGLATIDYRHVERLEERVEELTDIGHVKKEGYENREYVAKNHDAKSIAQVLMDIWEKVAE